MNPFKTINIWGEEIDTELLKSIKRFCLFPAFVLIELCLSLNMLKNAVRIEIKRLYKVYMTNVVTNARIAVNYHVSWQKNLKLSDKSTAYREMDMGKEDRAEDNLKSMISTYWENDYMKGEKRAKHVVDRYVRNQHEFGRHIYSDINGA